MQARFVKQCSTAPGRGASRAMGVLTAGEKGYPMSKTTIFWATAAVLLAALSCSPGRQSPVGFRLPENGDIGRGRAAFMELGCHECHKVVGENFPAPTADPPVPVALGGTVHEIRTDGYLVTSMINPSHKLAGYPKDQVATAEGKSRMPDETEAMTVRQLVDLVAYLQSRYKVVPAPHMYP